MPRIARTVFAGVPHHITQRGNRRSNVFFTDGDRRTYLHWLKGYCDQYGVDVLAYCLMKNHVHLVAVPRDEESLQAVLRPLHMRYAQRVNSQSRTQLARSSLARAIFLLTLGRRLSMGGNSLR
jgi:putative transposase